MILLFAVVGGSSAAPASPGTVPDDEVRFVLSWGVQGTDRGEFRAPQGLAVSPVTGNIAVADWSNHRIQVFDADGNFVEMGGFGVVDGSSTWQECYPTTPGPCQSGVAGNSPRQFNGPADVAFDRFANGYIVDRGNDRIQVMTEDADFLGAYGSTGTAEGQFRTPVGVAIAPDGHVYVSDWENHRVQHFDETGAFVATWGFGVRDGSAGFQICSSACGAGIAGAGDGQFNGPSGLAVASDGTVLVADAINHRVQRFDPNGVFLGAMGGPTQGVAEGSFQQPLDVTVDESDNLFVLDSNNHRVQQFDAAGNFIRMWGFGVRDGSNLLQVCTSACRQGIPGSAEGQLSSPNHIAVAGDEVYVADRFNQRVSKFVVNDPDPVETAQFFVEARGGNRLSRYLVGDDGSAAFELNVLDPSLSNPVALVFGPGGELFATNAGNASVSRFLDPRGAVPSNGTITADELGSPHWAGFRGNELLVGDPGYGAVLRFVIDGAGNAVSNGEIPVSPGSHIRGVRIDPATGELFVSLCCGTNRIERFVFDASGNAASNGAITGGGLSNPHDIAFSERGELFVVNGGSWTVSRFLPDGAGGFAPNGAFSDNLGSPLGLDFSPWGELFVAHAGGVERFVFDAAYNAIHNGNVATGGARDVQFVTEPPPVVNPPLAAAGGPYAGPEGTTILLDGNGSTASTGADIVSYEWDLGDDGTIDHTGVTFDYPALDDADVGVRLIVTDDLGGVGTDLTTITVTNVQPAVAAGPDRSYIGPQTINVSAGFSDPGTLDTHTATIDWGDGTVDDLGPVAGGASGGHAYGSQGVFNVVITVTDDDGGSASDTTIVTFDPTPPPLPGEYNVYVASPRANQATVIDAMTGSTSGLGVGYATGVAPSLDGRLLYASDGNANVVNVVEVLTGNTVASIPVDAGPGGLRMAPDGSELYVAHNTQISVVDTASGAVAGTIATAGGGIAFSPDGQLAYVSQNASNTVAVIDTETREVVTTVPVGGGPTGIDVAPDGSTLYVVSRNVWRDIYVLDLEPDPRAPTFVTAIRTHGSTMSDLKITPDGTKGIVSDQSGPWIRFFDTATNTLDGGVIPTDGVPVSLAISPDGVRAYVVAWFGCAVDVYDIASRAFVEAIPISCNSGQVAIGPIPPTHEPPVADAGGPYTGVEGGAINFDATGSTDPNDDIDQYLWDFDNDGVFEVQGATPSRIYVDDGTFTATLSVTDFSGLSSTASTTVTIVNLPPVVDAGPDGNVSGATPFNLTAAFVDPGTLDTVLSARVDWGDGTDGVMAVDAAAGTASASHVFGAEGTYLVRVFVEDNGGAVGTDSLIVGKDLISGGFDEFFLLTAGMFGAAGDQFGASVAIDGTTAVVGAPFSDDAGPDVGAAFVFEKDAGGWDLVQILTPPNPVPTDQFGVAVGLEGGTLVVGARLRDIPGVANNAGAAFIYERVALPGGGTMWGDPQEVFAADANPGDFFGFAVAVAADRVLVGAPNDDQAGTDAGALYVFEKREEWQQIQKIVDTTGVQAANDLLGSSVSGTDALLVAGAPARTNLSPSAGKVFVFELGPTGTSWQTRESLSGGAPGSQFGASVDIDADTLIIGAPRQDGEGIAYVTEQAGGPRFGPLIALRPLERPLNTRVGQSVGVSGNFAAVGAPFASDSAYGFERNGPEDWGGDSNGDGAADQAVNFTPNDTVTSAFFGQAVSASGSSILIGANLDDPLGDASGAAYVFTISQPVFGNNVSLGSNVDVGTGVVVGDRVVIGSNVVVGDNSKIGDNVDIGTGSSIGSGVTIESNTRLGPATSIKRKVVIRKSAVIKHAVSVEEGAAVGSETELANKTRVGRATKIKRSVKLATQSTIGANAFIGDDVVIGNHALIDDEVRIGDRTVIGSSVRIFKGASIGADGRIGDRSVVLDGAQIGDNVTLGKRVRVLAGAVIPDGTVVGNGETVGG